jgi:peroxiredoxin Q/BCP
VDPIAKNKEFAESLNLDYPILSDPEKKAAKAFGVLSGRGFASRVTVYVGKDGKVAFIDQKVSARSDGENVAKRLAELEFPKRK